MSASFNRLQWGYVAPAHPHGVLAAGLDNGEFATWDAHKLLHGAREDAQIFRNNRHRGPVRGVDFNKLSPNLLGSGGVNGEIYIWDLHDPRQAYSPGERSAKLGDITALAWNNKMPPILASASNSGNTVVWDLRNKSEVSCLTYGGAGPAGGAAFGAPGARSGGTSSVAWHPHVATRLVTASEDDANPVVSVWNLRNAHAPEVVLQGHTRGILSVGWCSSDEDLLVSCGKDNRTILWNPQTGHSVGELSPSTNWTFDAQWCPRNPNLIATASFDGQIGVHSLQSIENDETAAAAAREHEQAAALDDNDFFNNLPSVKAPALPAVSLVQPPKWLSRPVTAGFSFGGHLVSVHGNRSTVQVHQIATEPGIVDRAERLQQAVANGTLEEFAQDQMQAALADTSNPEEASNWAALQTLFHAGARDELVTLLGVSRQELEQKIVPALDQAKASLGDLLGPTQQPPAEEVASTAPPPNDPFAPTGDEANGGEDFFDNLGAASQAAPTSTDAATATVPEKGPFAIYPTGESGVDQDITRALVLGDFESAVSLCLSVERYADAILLAVQGGEELMARTQSVYFAKKSASSPFLRVYQSIVSEDLADIVANAELADWQETFVLLCTYAKSEDFGVLAEALGQRLEDLYYTGQAPDARKNATVCYLAAGRLEKMAQIWGDEMAEQEAAIHAAAQSGTLDPTFSQRGASSAHAEALQAFVEKVMVFEAAVGYVDVDLQNAPGSVSEDGYKLAPLYDRLLEYVNLLADQGLTDAATSFLQRTPPGYLALKGADAALDLLQAKGIARASTGYGQSSYAGAADPYNVRGSTTAAPSVYAPPVQSASLVGGGYGGGYAPAAPAKPVAPPAAVSSPYAPTAPVVPAVEPPAAVASNPYAPSSNPYAPAPGVASQAPSYSSPYGAPAYGAAAPIPPPPTTAQTLAAHAGAGSSPAATPSPVKRDASGWNDIPALAARRPASGMGNRAAPITAPFPNMPPMSPAGQATMGPPQGPPRGLTPRGFVPPPASAGPPMGGAPMRARTPGVPIPGSPALSARGAGPPMGPPRSSLSNAPGQQGLLSPPLRARTPMGPPAAANPYAPPPAMAGAAPGIPNGFQNGSAPGYAPPPSGAAPGGPSGFVPPPAQGFARMGTPGLPGVGSGPPPGSGAGARPAQPASPLVPAGMKYPPGDRSHVPPAHKPIVGVLSGEVAKFRGSGVPKRMADDVDSRVGSLLDALNNEVVPEPVIALLHELCKAIVARNAPAALDIHVQLATIVSGDLQRACVGIKQLISHMR